jgi:carbamoyltransferase
VLILGISDNHDAGAAVVADGRLLAAVGQERLDRQKNSGAFPWQAIETALGLAGVGAGEVDRIVVGSGYTPATALRALPTFHHARRDEGTFSYLLNLYILYQVALRRSGLQVAEIAASEVLLSRRLAARGFTRARLELMDHHEAHAQAAYRSQPRTECLVVTLDAMGDGATATVWEGRDGQLRRRWEQSGLASVNSFYSRITQLLGFRPNRHEGKITGLAAFAVPPPELLDHMRRRVCFQGPGFSRTDYWRPHAPDDRFWGFIARYPREEVAAAAQRVLEEAVTAFVRHHVTAAGFPHVAVVGGTFANVAVNRRVAELPEVESLFVYPNMGDGGLPVGAALGAAQVPPARLPHVYLGPSIEDAEVERLLSGSGLCFSRPADLTAMVAARIAERRVVARCAGPMEWGPRALGNRSILYRADDPAVNDWLNKRLKRTEFMPFAPMTLAEDAPGLYRQLGKSADAARFMTICYAVDPSMKRDCAGVIHVDGTARPQVLHREDNPEMHAILAAYKALTGTGTIVNTSFNMHEEPIVCSAQDALRAWRAADLDALVLGSFLVERQGSQPERSMA